jgi:endoglucanase
MFFLVSLVSSAVPTFGRMAVKNGKVVGANGDPVILRGVSLGWDTWWGQFYNEDTIQHLVTDFHANLIRAAIGIEPARAYLQDKQTALNHLDAAVKAAIKLGVYIIIDFHAHQLHTTEAKEFFTTVANKYKGSEFVIYEIWNEPESANWATIKQYAKDVIPVIRAIDPDAVILVSNSQWDQHPDEPAADPLSFTNIAYVVHFYAGTHGQWLRDRVTAALAKGIAIFVSECGGMNSDGDGAVSTTEWNNWVDLLEKNKISYATWCVEAKAESASILKVSANWNDLTDWGKTVKQTITSRQ